MGCRRAGVADFLLAGATMIAATLTFLSLALADTGSTGGGEPPVADAGLGLLAYAGDTVALNGTASRDPEGADLGYFWAQSGGPEVGIKNGDEAQPSFTVESPGTYRFTLVVNDGYQDSTADTVEIVVAHTSFGGDAEGGCATAGGVTWPALLGLLALVPRRRRTAAAG